MGHTVIIYRIHRIQIVRPASFSFFGKKDNFHFVKHFSEMWIQSLKCGVLALTKFEILLIRASALSPAYCLIGVTKYFSVTFHKLRLRFSPASSTSISMNLLFYDAKYNLSPVSLRSSKIVH